MEEIQRCVFSIVHNEEINAALSYINGINPHIQFTVDMEENECLPYLDLKI